MRSIQEKRTNRILAKDFEVSNDTWKTGLNNNDLIIGSSGSGKTGGYVIPNIQNIDGSLVVSDTKGQLYRKFHEELRKKGYETSVIDFVNPQNSVGYNPLQYVRRHPDGHIREQDVLTIANGIIPIMDKDEPIWEMSAKSYVAFLISFCLEAMPVEEQNMVTICDLHHSFIKSDLAFIEWLDLNPDSFATKKYREIMGVKPAEKMFSSILGFVNVALEPFEFREAKYIFGSNDNFKIESLGEKKKVLFLNVSDTDRTYDQLINVFYSQALQVLCAEADKKERGRLDIPVRIILDDFATSARIVNFDKIISVIRSREISVSIILQSMAQIEDMYDRAAITIIDNCDHIVYLGGQNQETAGFIGLRACKTPENILKMPCEKAFILTKGEEAKYVDKIKPYSTVSA